MKRLFALFCLLLCLGTAQAEEPTQVFSPAMDALTRRIASGETIEIEAAVMPDKLFFMPNTKVLSAVFSGMNLRVRTGMEGARQLSALAVERGGETLVRAQLCSDEGQMLLALSDKLLRFAPQDALPGGAWPALNGGYNRFARPDLSLLEETARAMGLSCTRHDGALSLSGMLSDWTLTGVVTLGAGKNPADKMELSLQRGADALALSVTITTTLSAGKGGKGTNIRKTLATLSGKLDGCGVGGKLTVEAKNAWQTTPEGTSERITVKTRASWNDKRPDRAMQNLGKIDFSCDETLRPRVDGWTGEADVTLETQGYALFSGQIQTQVTLGGEAPQMPVGAAESATLSALSALIRGAGEAAAGQIYRQLDPSTKALIQKGL